MIKRIRAAARVLIGRSGTVDRVSAISPPDLRPDPSARFNVFRVVNGSLVNEPEQYYGQDIRKALQAWDRYKKSRFPGSIYLYVNDDCVYNATFD